MSRNAARVLSHTGASHKNQVPARTHKRAEGLKSNALTQQNGPVEGLTNQYGPYAELVKWPPDPDRCAVCGCLGKLSKSLVAVNASSVWVHSRLSASSLWAFVVNVHTATAANHEIKRAPLPTSTAALPSICHADIAELTVMVVGRVGEGGRTWIAVA